MNRHQTVIQDGCEKLRTAARLYADAMGVKIVGVRMGLHIFNTLAHLNRMSGTTLEVPRADLIPDGVTYGGVPVTIYTDGRTGEPTHLESMPVYEFEAVG